MKHTTYMILILLFALILSACSSAPTEEQAPGAIEGTPVYLETATPEPIVAPIKGGIAPDFELESIEGKLVNLSDFQGTPIIINFWATWCPPCVHEMPILRDKYAQSASFEVLAVNNMEPYFVVRDFANELELLFPVLLDLGDNVRELYNINNFPTTIFIDADGVIRNIHIGGLTEGLLEGYLAEIGITE